MKREFDLFKCLIHNQKGISIEELADRFHVTSRTIRDDLNKLEEFLVGSPIHIIREHGVIGIDQNQVDTQSIANIMMLIREKSDFYSNEDRFNIMLQRLLLGDRCSIQSLSDEIKVARSATIRTLNECEKWLNENGITLIKRSKKGIQIQCDEFHYRKACVAYINSFFNDVDYQALYNDLRNNRFLLLNVWANNLINYFIKDIDLMAVRDFIRQYEKEESVRFTDESFLSIFFIICIVIQRNKNDKSFCDCDFKNILTDLTSLEEWADKNQLYFEKHFKVSLNNAEMRYLFIWLLSSNKRYKGKNEEDRYNEKVIVNHFLEIVDEYLATDLTKDETLLNNLMMHLTPAIHRMVFDMEVENPLKEQIQNEYPEIYKACKKASQFLKDQFGMMPSDDEISFMTMHIAVSIEKNKKTNRELNFYNTIVVCTSGVATSNMLSAKLYNAFPNIIVERVCSIDDYHNFLHDGVDFIVSTIALLDTDNTPVFCVSPLLKENDIREIRNFMMINTGSDSPKDNQLIDDIVQIVEEVYGEGQREKLRTKIQRYFSKVQDHQHDLLLSNFAEEDKVLLQIEGSTPEEVIRTAAYPLYFAGNIEEKYIDALLSTKQTMGSQIGIVPGVVLAHAKSSAGVKETGMSFMTLKTPMIFGIDDYDPIKLVIVLAATNDNCHLSALSELLGIVENERVLADLIEAESFSSFRNILIQFEHKTLRR